jgi:hypothetical protein
MSAKAKFILGREFILALIDAGIVPEACTSAIIEAHVGEAVQLHYTIIGDDRLVGVVAAEAKAAGVTEAEVHEEPKETHGVRRYITDPETGKQIEVTTP